MALVIAGLLTLSWLVKYPDVVQASMYLTTERAPYSVTPKVNGRIRQILVQDNQFIQSGQILAVMESSANFNDIELLRKRVEALRPSIAKGQVPTTFLITNLTHLGELQPAFEVFSRTWIQVKAFTQKDYYQHKKAIINSELSVLNDIINKMQEQLILLKQDAELGKAEFNSQRALYEKKVVAEIDYRKAASQYLAKQLPVKQEEQSLLNVSTQLSSKQNELIELDKQYLELHNSFIQAFNSLDNIISEWNINHLLIAPVAGFVTIPITLQTNQQVRSDSSVFFVTPQGSSYIGIAKIPQQNSGKVRSGQRVIIKLAGYPFQEYGTIRGVITEVTPLSESDNTYHSKILLPQGLNTSYKKHLHFRNGLVGTADIVTDNESLLNRIIYSFRIAIQK